MCFFQLTSKARLAVGGAEEREEAIFEMTRQPGRVRRVFDRLSLGWESYQTDGVRTIYLDDVVVSRTPIGCPAP